MGLQPRPNILEIPAPYVQGVSELDAIECPIKLSANESEFGPSPRAIAAYEAESRNLNRYPDGSQTRLREAIGKAYGLDPRRIVCGNGSDELIQLLTRSYVGPGDEVILSECSFEMCRIHALAQGADIKVAPEHDFMINVEAILERVTPRTRLVPIANPNNPTGTYLPAGEIEGLHADLPGNTLLLLDSAYAEYVDREDYESGTALVESADNVVMTRTFSKIFGLAGLRIGWAYCPISVINVVERIRTPFNANRAAMAAAIAALEDAEFTERVRAHTVKWIKKMTFDLTELGLQVIPSVANFIFIRFPDDERNAKAAATHLQEQGIIPRPVGVGGPQNALRITIGLSEHNEAVLRALTDFMRDQ